MLTKTQARIMELFTSSITRGFNFTPITEKTGIDRKNVSLALKSLVQKKLINLENRVYSLNYGENHQTLAYVEHLRSREFINRKKNAYVKLVVDDVLDKVYHPSFIFLLFGSRVTADPRADDVDLMIIVETEGKAKEIGRIVERLKSPLRLEIKVYWHDAAYEMLQQREEKSVLHQTLNKHVIFHGAESYYRLITRRGR